MRRARGRRQRHALVEHPLVALERQVAEPQLAVAPSCVVTSRTCAWISVSPQRAGHRDAVMAVLDEVQLADPVDVDRRQRPRRGGGRRRSDSQRPRTPVGGRPEGAVEGAGGAIDRADDRVQPDLLHAEVGLAGRPSAATTSSNGSIGETSSGSAAQARGDQRERAPAALAVEVALGGDL